MRSTLRKIGAFIIALASACTLCMPVYGMGRFTAGTRETVRQSVYYSGLTPVMGSSQVTLGQLINYYEKNEDYPAFYMGTDAPNIYTFCKIYMEECAAEGVRAEVAFAQAMKETGFLRYRGDVSIHQLNFAGIGATGGGEPGNSFPSVRIGIRAQVQHLKAYATTDPLNHWVVDPRYEYVPKGSAPYVEWLGKSENPSGIGWATAYRYGYSVVDDYMVKALNTSRYSSWYNGVDYSAVYDPEYYMEQNPDVAVVFGGSSEALISHFLYFGMDEGRVASAGFDVNSYRLRYKDLRTAFGYQNRQYYYHYLNAGQYEGRQTTGTVERLDGVTVYNGVDYGPVYDYQYYIEHNPDVGQAFGNDDIAVLQHFVTNGMREGRQASAGFDVQSYKRRYKDLRQAFGNDMQAYFTHYLKNGTAEQRVAVGEVAQLDGVTVYNGVDYSSVYDFNYYVNAHPDLKAAYGNDDLAALEHFVRFGMSEGRQAAANFGPERYRDRYVDLQAAFGDDWSAYYRHYLDQGIREGRVAS